MSVTSFSAILKLEEPFGVTLWESEAARELSDAKAGQIRPQVEQATGGTMQSVERYEVLFYDVRLQQDPRARFRHCELQWSVPGSNR